MKLSRYAAPVLVLIIALAVPGFAMVQSYGPSPAGYGQGPGGWDAPPGEFRDAQRQGFHDGIEGARKDLENHRHPDVNNRDEYRHPSVPHAERRDYRDGFRRGYDTAMAHLLNGGPGPR
ncbi:hypothetical protein [Granulicella sp. S190]|uniref:hypothetical protein n=1 Tax=Granulicella sp. S190 TaxID=1747226 RepID=UPI00131C4402|nr:hypothetical protein [Granulicella sp. S190]